jgi:hydroxymethylpyrimidine/phosphomethylpyrimidine kinase
LTIDFIKPIDLLYGIYTTHVISFRDTIGINMRNKKIAKSMTIAGSDSGGGAGIQADLKTFSALGVYGTSVITAITAQNTLSVNGIHAIPTDLILSQFETVMDDIGTDSIKIGMLFSTEIIETVADILTKYNVSNIVLDPVMISKSGDNLLSNDCIDILKRTLLPLAMVVTPNIPEAEELTGLKITGINSMIEASKYILDMGAKSIILKGGHMEGDPIDYFFDGENGIELVSERIDTPNTHGTGCTFSSAVAANLALGYNLEQSARNAQLYVHEAIDPGFTIGNGHGPLNHFYKTWK